MLDGKLPFPRHQDLRLLCRPVRRGGGGGGGGGGGLGGYE